MSKSRVVERLALVALTTLVVWNTWHVRRHERTIDELTARLAAAEARPRMPVMVPPEMFRAKHEGRGGGGNGGGGGGGGGGRAGADANDGIGPTVGGGGAATDAPPKGARNRNKGRKSPSVAGAAVLDRLYAAADEMAAEEDWPDETYDRVSSIFEDTTAEMTQLVTELKGGRVSQAEARDEVLRIRDDALGGISEVIGEDGLHRLRGYIKEDGANK